MGYNRGHILQLLYMLHDLMVSEEQTYAAALILDVIKNVKNKPDSEIKEILEEYKPNSLVNII